MLDGRTFTSIVLMQLLLTLGGCSGSPPPPSEAPDRVSPSSLDNVVVDLRSDRTRRLEIINGLLLGTTRWSSSTDSVLMNKNAHWIYFDELSTKEVSSSSLDEALDVPATQERIARFAEGFKNVDTRRKDSRGPDEVVARVSIRGEESAWVFVFGFSSTDQVLSLNVDIDRPKGTGTCFAVSDTLVVTANHVVADATRVSVQFEGEHSTVARVIKRATKTDLALLKIPSRKDSKILTVAPSGDIQLGDEVFTVGFPRPGVMGWAPKYTAGTVSSLKGIRDSSRSFQMSVPIQPGNSGGPVIDEQGRVIGVVTHMLRKGQVVNYAARTDLLAKMGVELSTAAPKKDRRALIKNAQESVCKVRSYGEKKQR